MINLKRQLQTGLRGLSPTFRVESSDWRLILIRTCSDEKPKKTNFLQSFFEKLSGKQPNHSESSNGESPPNRGGRSIAKPTRKSKDGEMVVLNPEARFRTILVCELNRRPLIPGTATPVVTTDQKLVDELKEMHKSGGPTYVGAFLRKPEAGTDNTDGISLENLKERDPDDPAGHLYEIGTFAQVQVIMPTSADDGIGGYLMLLGHKRIKRIETVSTNPLKVTNQTLRDKDYDQTDYLKAMTMQLVSAMHDLFQLHPLYREQLKSLQTFVAGGYLSNISRLADVAAGISSAEDLTLQKGILEELDVPTKAQKALELLKKEIDIARLQKKIEERVEEKISKDQRRHFLMEQLKSIKKELGLEKDEKSALTQKFQSRYASFKEHASEEVRTVIEEELDKLNALEPVSSEFTVTRNYLEWLTSIPWGKYSEERLDVDHAKQVLDEDHYGLKDVKDRILEFIAVGLLKGNTQGKILCLVGPPGVGKTSIGSSIAKALNRKYYRFSVGGLNDVAEIKGHRRTYVGAMPGKMVQCLKSIKTSNPFVCIDEIDKIGKGYQGDPSSALLELLDPAQNTKFVDYYLDVPVDLSKVLFMCTANLLDTIPGPLLDRMEVIRLSGYLAAEKKAIAKNYLEPQTVTDCGIPEGSVKIEDDAMEALIKDYCREAGVRNLKKHIEKVYRKCALKLVRAGAKGPKELMAEAEKERQENEPAKPTEEANSEKGAEKASGDASEETPSEPELPKAVYEGETIVVNASSLHDLVGAAPFKSDKIFADTPPGVVMGLAWTSMGGSTLYAESAIAEKDEGKGGLRSTGQLGEVMKESAVIAHTLAKSFLLSKDPANPFFKDSLVHVHFPEGAVPKDGPSAGVTLVTSLLSLALDQPVKKDLAMTGEVTLTGMVLPVGGIKEKTIAARRSEVKHIIFPEGNRKDFEELDEDIKADVEVYFVKTYSEVYDIAFSNKGV